MTSNEFKLRWQRDAHKALGEFLATAAEIDLPAVTWTIATSGALSGDVVSLGSTPVAMRLAFRVWANRRGADVTERTTKDGVAHLYAKFVWAKKDTVRGAIRATIYPPLEDGGE
ncbi:hypothetical protein [Streptomyces virginiae]|uniref:hypothetical protein n=1 Tax=Streptomyces virginiae TaxID=1961 RepID=UPI0035E153BE